MSAAKKWKVKPDSDQWAVRVGGDQAGPLPTKKARPGLIRVESKSINSESENGAKTTPCLIERDPRALNAHVQIEFSNIFGEADDAHSLQCTWRISSRVFTCCQRTCYQCWSALCACPVSMAYGIVFGATAVAHVWSLTPAWRFFDTCVIDPLRSFARLCCIQMCLTWCEALGGMLRSFKILNNVAPGIKKKEKVVTFGDKVKFRTIPARYEPTEAEILAQRKLSISRAKMPSMRR